MPEYFKAEPDLVSFYSILQYASLTDEDILKNNHHHATSAHKINNKSLLSFNTQYLDIWVF